MFSRAQEATTHFHALGSLKLAHQSTLRQIAPLLIITTSLNEKYGIERLTLMNLLTTLKGSLLESFFPPAWDLAQWDACVADDPNAIFDRQPKWHQDFSIRMANDVADFDVILGHDLALEIRRCREAGRKLALILPAGPMGMYRWTAYFLCDWSVPCDHVHEMILKGLQEGRLDLRK